MTIKKLECDEALRRHTCNPPPFACRKSKEKPMATKKIK